MYTMLMYIYYLFKEVMSWMMSLYMKDEEQSSLVY